MNRRSAITLVSLCLLASACGPGGPTSTPAPTATSISTLAPAPTSAPTNTETALPTATATAAAIAAATATLPPTAFTCPKGTALNPTVNLCFYATRTPKSLHKACEVYTNHTDCTKNGCTWINLTKTCKP